MVNSKSTVGLTVEQTAAVGYRGGALLVSAAAGSGKTKVLVERLLSRVDEGDNIDEFLVITYTRAAAAELRERILEEIAKRIDDDPRNRRLRRQLMLCRGAKIDTIHAFCTDILRENGHMAELPPDFRVADESESVLIKTEVLDDLLNKKYETLLHMFRNSGEVGTETPAQGSTGQADGSLDEQKSEASDFRELVDALSTGRDDRRLVAIILDVHAKLQSNPDPREWVKKQIENLYVEGIADMSETVWGRRLMDKTRAVADFWLSEMISIREEMRDYPAFEKAYGDSVNTTISGIEAFRRAMDISWDEARLCSAIDFPRTNRASGYEELKDVRKRCKAALEKCADIFECSSIEHIEDMLAVAPALSELLRLVLDFDDAFSKEKRRRGIVDFSDLEHLTLTMLTDVTTGEKTELARSISCRFKEIMVDEYQDVNAVQEMIFSAVSQEGGNIFMVGDVKQSIYRFRLADPSIFLKKYSSFTDVFANTAEVKSRMPRDGAKILLSRNFRSRSGILDTVNFIFENIMSSEFGEMDYTERESLIPGRDDGGDAGAAVEIDVIDMSALEHDEDEESPAKAQVEARFVAKRISMLVDGGYRIPDGHGGERSLVYSDIVILLRSMQGKAWQYSAALSELGIPVDMPGGEGFFETVEIDAALSLLSVIDNPMQDIPLAAALGGPVYGFTADELAEIRAESRGTDFFTALTRAAEDNAKFAGFLEDIDALRSVMQDMPSDRFIHYVYNKTGMLGRVGAMRGGKRRRENLLLLAEYARRFEQSGYRGLFGFLTYIRGLQEKGMELQGEAAALSDNAVRIMSIHKSKGLEFPVVFLADTSKRLNNADALKPLVMHQKIGVGAVRTDKQRRIEYPTLPLLAVRSALTSEMMAEELRVLYVAMTRAREKLIITAAFANAEREMEKLSRISRNGISPQALEETKNMAGWVLMPILRRQGSSDAMELRVEKDVLATLAAACDSPGVPPFGGGEKVVVATVPFDRARAVGEDVEMLRERFDFVYPYAMAPELPSKLTVTGLSRESGVDGGAVADVPVASESHSRTVSRRFAYARPGFITGKSLLTAAERGTALHLAMQYVDFSQCLSTGGVKEEERRLAHMGLLTVEQAAAVDAQKI
ncbi:MAG: UvrD-helicase domain-containing protein, partial [Oscillospiraceae bacterium]|nr:UvrD-helicase domain-containing protein [Oscillospiraceae bacterium]